MLDAANLSSSHSFERRRVVIAALQECSGSGNLERGKRIHQEARRNGDESHACVASMLISMYAKCKSIENARKVFDNIENPNVVCWNALLLGYAANGEGEVSLNLFSLMGRQFCVPDARSFVAAAKACIDLALKDAGAASRAKAKKLHLLALESGHDLDVYVQGTFVDMFAKCGSISDARRVFHSVKDPDVVAWTAIILGHADNGEAGTSMSLFLRMRREGCVPNSRTFVACLKACAYLAVESNDKSSFRQLARVLHLLAVVDGCGSNVYVQATLVDAYAKCRSMEDALIFFSRLKRPSVVCWNALMFGYADNGQGDKALECFTRMKREGYVPNANTFVAAFRACGLLGSLDFGRALHAEVCTYDFKESLVVTNCLVDFYAKCGGLAEAQRVFDSAAQKSVVTWNALIAGCSRQGATELVFDHFSKMLEARVQPNGITFLSLLTACCHAGLVAKGKEYFGIMSAKYRVHPSSEHYTCMIDMLGRANELDEAMAMNRAMHFTPDVVTWMTILGSCRKWKYLKLGKLAFEALLRLTDGNAGGVYVVMARIYEGHASVQYEDVPCTRTLPIETSKLFFDEFT